MKLVRWTPTSAPARRNFWADPFVDLFDLWASDNRDSGLRVDLVEKDDHYVISAELPGVKSEDLNISVDNDVLTISAEKRDEFEGQEGGVYRRERSFGRVSRSFQLGSQVDVDKIDAEYKDGVLKLTLPKVEKAKPREVKVKVKNAK
ncbi:MAG: Hsp20/alpha crystallin family protein [Candidatus Glassbacteria bacterium]|nr:Hsp20/alpha crystallin family protein [Candidatus Glassbacteria bacterium]